MNTPPAPRAAQLPQDRRAFIRHALLSGGLPLLAVSCAARPGPTRGAVPAPLPPNAAMPLQPSIPPAPVTDLLPAPDLSPGQVLRFSAGIRPFRQGRVRIEAEPLGGKTLVHNYGHGGAGITLSWGSAAEVLRIVRERTAATGPARPDVAILGAGVIGMTAAHELLRAGHRVRIYARDTLERTTSWVAGGQWAPALVARGNPPGDPGFFERLLRNSHARYSALAASASDSAEWGVFPRVNYAAGRSGGSLRLIPPGILPPPEDHDSLPIAGLDIPGQSYRTMIVEPPVFLPRLARELERLGAEFRARVFASLADAADLPEPVVVNCLGLAAREVAADPRVVPIRGQLVHLRPQDLPYLFTHDNGYIFPRGDAVIVGGTAERGVTDATPDPDTCARIIERSGRLFRRTAAAAGGAGPA